MGHGARSILISCVPALVPFRAEKVEQMTRVPLLLCHFRSVIHDIDSPVQHRVENVTPRNDRKTATHIFDQLSLECGRMLWDAVCATFNDVLRSDPSVFHNVPCCSARPSIRVPMGKGREGRKNERLVREIGNNNIMCAKKRRGFLRGMKEGLKWKPRKSHERKKQYFWKKNPQNFRLCALSWSFKGDH